MDPIDIARLEERRMAVAMSEIALEHQELAGGVMAFSEKGSWTNQACALGLRGPVSEHEIDQLVEFYTSRAVEPKIEVCAFADESLVKGLASRAFTLREFENVMACDVRSTDAAPTAPHARPEGLEIVRVDPADEARVNAFIRVSIRPFVPEDQPIPAPMERAVRRVVAHPRSESLLALLDGEPVGGGGLECAGEIACLFGAGVDARCRRRGIQQALILRRLEIARERNCRVVCIHGRPGMPTERNARRLGFSLAYTKAVLAMAGHGLEPSP
ncbi:MAG: GNAT family N-acetyltransferase [Phycisphaeraceae bacterium]|nr:GNAT family N-acetyltransferase [Phycisphaeraceae bacterium]